METATTIKTWYELRHEWGVKVQPADIMGKRTTVEQWDKWLADVREHYKIYNAFKPRKEDLEFVDQTTSAFRQDLFDKAISEWERGLSCDCPNEPGYTRANND